MSVDQLSFILSNWTVYIWLNFFLCIAGLVYGLKVAFKPENEWARSYAVFVVICSVLFFALLSNNIDSTIAALKCGDRELATKLAGHKAVEALYDACKSLVNLIGVIAFNTFDIVCHKRCRRESDRAIKILS